MRTRSTNSISRRRVLKWTSAALASATTHVTLPRRTRAQRKQLRIMQWAHFVPGYDHWFNESFTKQWGEKNNVSVTIDNVGLGDLGKRANAEVSARSGHDLIGFVAPPAVHEDDVIDHREIYQECQKRYGKVVDFALRSTYNPKTDKYFGVCHAYAPA